MESGVRKSPMRGYADELTIIKMWRRGGFLTTLGNIVMWAEIKEHVNQEREEKVQAASPWGGYSVNRGESNQMPLEVVQQFPV